MKKSKVSSAIKKWKPWFIIIFFFLAVYSCGMVVWPAPAAAGPLYDHYGELKNGYPQFFDRLLLLPEKYHLTDQQLQDWLGDVDDKLAGDPEVINSSNFSSKLTNALLNTLFLPENEAVRTAVFAEYGEEINQYVSNQILSLDLLGFYNTVKTVVLDHVVIPNPSPEPMPQTYPGPLQVALSGFVQGTVFYYTLDGSPPVAGDKPAASSFQYTGTPIAVALAQGPQTLKAVACKQDAGGKYYFSDIYTFVYDVARGTVRGTVRLEALARPENAAAFLLLDGRQIPLSLDSQGAFEANNVPAGTRTLFFSAAGYLSKKVPFEVSPEKVTVAPEVILRAGDLNNDGIIDLLDLGILSGAYGSRQGAGSFAGAADVNKDGCVDLADLGWLASNYGAVGD